MAGGRFILAGAALCLWARFVRKDTAPQRVHWRATLIFGALLLLGGNGMVVWAEHSIPSCLAALLVASEPLWVVLLNWVRPGGVSANNKVVLGLGIGFAGVWLLVGGGAVAGGGAAGGGQLFGVILVLAAAFSWALGSIYSLNAAAPKSP